MTGHTGFLGSVILHELRKSFQVLTLGRDQSCDYCVDLLNWDGSLELEHNVDAIVHVAGIAHDRSVAKDVVWTVNAISADRLLVVSKKNSIRTFVYISSVAVYGKSFGFCFDECEPTRPTTFYGKSKLYSEEKIKEFAKFESQSHYLIIRLPLVIGKSPKGNLGFLINSISNGSHIFINGNQAEKSVVFASDVALFIAEWLSSDCLNSGTVNLCNQTHPTVNWIERAIAYSGNYSFRYVINLKIICSLIVWLKLRVGISLPFVGKIAYSLTFSDRKARENFNYKSRLLTHDSFKEEISLNDVVKPQI